MDRDELDRLKKLLVSAENDLNRATGQLAEIETFIKDWGEPPRTLVRNHLEFTRTLSDSMGGYLIAIGEILADDPS